MPAPTKTPAKTSTSKDKKTVKAKKPKRAAIAKPAAGTAKAVASKAKLDPVTAALCSLVKQQRQKLGWTLEKMSTACGVSRSMLSQIERGQANPTLAVAYRIARALGISLGDLVQGPRTGSTIDVIHSQDKSYHFRSDRFCKIRTLSPLRLEKDVEFYELTLRPGATLKSAPHFAGTREFITIESGAARVTSGKDQTDLALGDSAHYPADVEHAIDNLSKADTIAFLVVTYGNA